MSGVKALIFDVFGTIADWRSGIARETEASLAPLGVTCDWNAFAEAWRGQYQPVMELVRSGQLPFSRLDVLHRRNLDHVLRVFKLDHIDEAARVHLNLAWHRLPVWPDVAPGLARLRQKFLLAPCSNGNIALMVNLARHNGLVWDAILGAEVARDYKPRPIVYVASVEALGLMPAEVMMVAAHSSDLAAARACGLRTAFVARPDEYGAGTGEVRPAGPVDLAVSGFGELAQRLGV